MKRIAALAGTTTAMLAVTGFALSGTALASTGDPGPRQGAPSTCSAPSDLHPGPGTTARACVTFSVSAGSSTLTEVSGPHLRTGDELFYQGQVLTVARVSGDSFTATRNGRRYADHGPAIRNEVAILTDDEMSPVSSGGGTGGGSGGPGGPGGRSGTGS